MSVQVLQLIVIIKNLKFIYHLKLAKANPEGTYIIVTDLFLSSKQLVGGTLSQLTKPLKSILKKGKSSWYNRCDEFI